MTRRDYGLRATPDTVHWGYFDRSLAPVLRIRSGDLIAVETFTHHAADAHKRAVIALVDRLLQAAGHAGPDLARSFVMLMDGAIVTAVREGDPGAALRAKAIAALMLEDAAATAGSTPSGIHR